MEIKIGCDLVHIGRFDRSANKGSREFLDRVFSASELAQASAFDTLAGMFAAKEAVIKALAMKAGEWRKIEIGKNNHSRPEARLADFSRRIVAHDLSISHDGEYAVAAAVFLLESE